MSGLAVAAIFAAGWLAGVVTLAAIIVGVELYARRCERRDGP